MDRQKSSLLRQKKIKGWIARSYFNWSRVDSEDNDETFFGAMKQKLIYLKTEMFEALRVWNSMFALQRRRLLHHIIYLLSYDLGLFRVVELPIL